MSPGHYSLSFSGVGACLVFSPPLDSREGRKWPSGVAELYRCPDLSRTGIDQPLLSPSFSIIRIFHVAHYENRAMPLYVISAFWAGQEGYLPSALLVAAMGMVMMKNKGSSRRAPGLEPLYRLPPVDARKVLRDDGRRSSRRPGMNPPQDPWMAIILRSCSSVRRGHLPFARWRDL